MVTIRSEAPGDRSAVRRVNEDAFGQPGEANLVEALHADHAVAVALVAERERHVVGHILFSFVSVEPAAAARLVGLGPMAVLPGSQRQGIGTQLVQEGLKRCRSIGQHAVVVVGHPDYYPRFGFFPAASFGLRCEYDVPSDAFMALELVPGALQNVSGLVRYHRAFSGL